MLGFGFWYIFSEGAIRRNLSVLLVLLLAFVFASRADRFEPGYPGRILTQVATYFDQVSSPGIKPELRAERVSGRLPESFSKRIGDDSVDILRFRIADLIQHQLNYNPRPVFQTYAAYNPYLDQLNATKYLSESAPRYLIYHFQGIDRRYAFFDESRTKQAIRSNYEVIDSKRGILLLERRERPRPLEKVPVSSSQAALGTSIAVPSSPSNLYFQADISYSLLGYLAKTFHQAPQLEVTFALSDNSTENHRALKPALSSDVYIEHYINSRRETKLFFDNTPASLRRIKRITLSTRAPWAFKPDFTARFTSYIGAEPQRSRG